GRKYESGVLPKASFSEPALMSPALNRARIAPEPPTPTPVARTKRPPRLSYSKYCPARSRSKSSHQLQALCGREHSLTRLALPPLEPPPPVTLICALALLPLLVTVIVALPDATPVTRPVASNLAI